MSMSIGMAQGMNALISVNSQLADLQAQALSGKKINNASDGLAAYLSAKNYSDRSNRLSGVNDTLSTNLQTIKSAQTGLNSIRSTITDVLDTLKAASQTQSYAAASSVTDATAPSILPTSIGLSFGMLDQSGNTSGTAITSTTRLVAPMTVLGSNVGTLRINNVALSDGQVFSVNGKAIRISAQDPSRDTVQDGTAANPVYVKTVGDLLSQLRGALTGGSDTSGTAAQNFNTLNAASNKITLTGSGSGANGQITFSQLAGTQVDITKIFSGTRKNQTNPTANYTEDQAGQVSAAASGYQTFTVGAVDQTITGGTNGQTPDPRRAAAAKSYKLAIDQIGQYLKSASVSGINLLNGDSLKVTFDEKGSNTTFQLQDAANNALTFSAASLGLVNAQTGASSDVANNFQTNEDAAVDANGNSTLGLNAAINKLTNALNTLNLGDSQVAQFQATTQNRVDFNKNIVSLLNDAANNLTAADMSQVAAQTAALQVQQSFAQTILGNTKQSDQSILQLLR